MKYGHNKIQGYIYRIKVRNYRFIYSVVNNELVIEVIRVRHRKAVYKNFPNKLGAFYAFIFPRFLDK